VFTRSSPCRSRLYPDRGFTLSEVMVSIATFLVLSTTILGMVITSLRYLRSMEANINAQNYATQALDYMSAELRQGIPNFSSRGFSSITPSVQSTSILMPNQNTKTSTTLEFNIPNFDGDGSGSQWDPTLGDTILTNPAYFKKIKYYVQNNKTLRRQVITYDSSGTASTLSDDDLINISNSDGSISITCTWESADLVDLQVSVSEGYRTFTAQSRVYILVRN